MKLRTRIAIASASVLAVAILAASAVIYVSMRTELRGAVQQTLEANVARFEQDAQPPRPGGRGSGRGRPGNMRRDPNGGPPLPNLEQRSERAPFGSAPGYIQFINSEGIVQRPPDELEELPVSKSAERIARNESGEELSEATVDGTHLLVLTRGISGGAVQAARPLNEVDRVLSRVLAVLAAVWVLGILVAMGLGLLIARTALKPIVRFTERTEAIADARSVEERMEVVGSDELARLAITFNSTLDALETSVSTQRHLVADASHELRTPISSLRANIQMLDDAHRLPPAEAAALKQDIIHELDELTDLVADIVELARGTDASYHSADDEVHLDRIVEEVIAKARRRGGKELTYEVAVQPALITGDPARLSRAVNNLIDNARKFSPEGSTIQVTLSAEDEGTVLTVRDHGPGFEQEDLPHVFERFYRSPAARSQPGSGLGLAIVEQAIHAASGHVSASNAEDGGAVLTVVFPA